jgi:hypothetical protein
VQDKLIIVDGEVEEAQRKKRRWWGMEGPNKLLTTVCCEGEREAKPTAIRAIRDTTKYPDLHHQKRKTGSFGLQTILFASSGCLIACKLISSMIELIIPVFFHSF